MRIVVLGQIPLRRTQVSILELLCLATLVQWRSHNQRRKLHASDVMAYGRHQRSSEQEESTQEKLLQLLVAEDVECVLALSFL